MAVLDKIRTKLGVLITVLIAVALLSFIVDPTTIDVMSRTFSSKYDVGEINGKSVKYEEFQSKVDYYTNLYHLSSGQQSVSEQALESIYNSAWQDLESEYLIIPTMRDAGVRVGEEETFDLCQGAEISPVLAQDPAFCDATGKFSRDRVIEFIQSIPMDQTGNMKTYWDFVENNIVRQQYFTKYTSLISKSNVMNPVELRRNIEENNTTSDAEFVVVPFGFQPDSTIQVSDSEIKAYYNKNKKNYRQVASRDIEYVVFEVQPSTQDIEDARQAMDKAYAGFAEASNLKTYLAHNSDTPLQEYYYKAGELEKSFPELDVFAFGKNQPKTLAPFQKDQMFYAARVSDRKQMADSAFVKHILLPMTEEAKADSLLNELKKGADFVAMATEYSADKNPNVKEAGDLGWMTQTMMIPGFESVLTAKTNQYFKINSNYGIHLVKVTEQTKKLDKVQLALLTKEIVASERTFQHYYAQANDLVVKSEGQLEKFNEAVSEGNLPVVPARGVKEGAKSISRYKNTREVSRWIYEAELGEVSPILTVDNQYFFVVALTGVHEEGYAPVSQVAESIRYTLTQEKRAEKVKAEVAEKIAGLTTLEAIAEALNAKVSTREGVAFAAQGSQAVDPALVGAIAGAKEQTLTAPVAGRLGVYVLNIKGREVGSFYNEDDAAVRHQAKNNYHMNILPSVFAEMGEVKDNRARFF
jgi:peptidyl-prolyl cis-trans isomerase D